MTNQQIEKKFPKEQWEQAKRTRNRIKAGKLTRWGRERKKIFRNGDNKRIGIKTTYFCIIELFSEGE